MGRCRICGRVRPLSFEHVPPESAFNDSGMLLSTIGAWIVKQQGGKTRDRYQQHGGGVYSLCEPCNNNTGSWYGCEYVRWAKRIMPIVAQWPASQAVGLFAMTACHPLRLLKQAVTMFLAVGTEGFTDKHPALRRFVLDKTAAHLPPEYEFYMNFYRGPEIRTIPLAGRVKFETGAQDALGEVAFPPMAFVMTFESPPRDIPGRITHFASYRFEQVADVLIPMVVAEGHTIYPEDYRSKQQVEREAQQNKTVAARLSEPKL